MKTVLITGCSSGFGLASAGHFLDRGWRVVATMRQPRGGLLPISDRLRVLALDVRDARSVAAAIADAGPIDALVNNAGFGAAAAFECMSFATIRDLFETNTLGVMAMSQAVLPQFRQHGGGVIVNVSSIVAWRAQPLLASYRASKAAVNAFTESLAVELATFNIRVHVVVPGHAPETSFRQNALPRMEGKNHPAYAELFQRFFSAGHGDAVTYTRDVVDAIWRAITDPTSPVTLPAGKDAVALDPTSQEQLIALS